MTCVIGCSRVPLPPARIMPFIETPFSSPRSESCRDAPQTAPKPGRASAHTLLAMFGEMVTMDKPAASRSATRPAVHRKCQPIVFAGVFRRPIAATIGEQLRAQWRGASDQTRFDRERSRNVQLAKKARRLRMARLRPHHDQGAA